MKQYSSSSRLYLEEWVVGQVILEVALNTPHNLFRTYLASRPLLADSFNTPRPSTSATTTAAFEKTAAAAAATAADLTIQNVNLRVLAINIFRLKKALLPSSLQLLLLDYPLFFLVIVTYLFVVPTWALPLNLALLILLNGALTNSSPSFSFSSTFPSSIPLEFCPSTPPSSIPPSSSPHPIEFWPHRLVERVLQMEAYSAPKKIRRLINLVRWTQDFLGIISSLLERASYLLSWADPHVTLPMAFFVIAVALLMSLLLYVISPVVVAWCVLVWVYFQVRRRINEMKDGVTDDGAAQGGVKELRKVINEEEDKEADGMELFSGMVEVNEKKGWVGDASKSFILNILARTPDALDLIHRGIARQRVHELQRQILSDSHDDRAMSERRKVD